MTAQRLRDWVSYVQNHPEDIQARHVFIKEMPHLIAKMDMKDNMILYRISRMFTPGSDKHIELLEKAADMGNTHAMFDIAQQSLAVEHKPIARALKYLRKSGDSFMRQQAETLLESHPNLQKALQENPKVSAHSMFQKRSTTNDHCTEVLAPPAA